MQGDVIDSWEERLRLTLDHFRNENMADFRKNSEAYRRLVREEEEAYAKLDTLNLTEEQREVIEEALRRMHLEEERDKVLMVGDRSHDVQGAISCGLQCIGVAYGYGSREELEKAGAVYIADSVEDLGILASPNDEETTENVESVRNIIPDREKVKKYEIPETRKLGKE